jgi:hypothetical protein
MVRPALSYIYIYTHTHTCIRACACTRARVHRERERESCHNFCYNFHSVQSWRQWGGRVVRMAVCGLLSLQVGTCAKAVCSHLSQRQHGVGCQVERCCGKSRSQIFKLLKPLKISRMFIYPAIKHYKELWRVEDGAHSGRMKSVRAEATIKTVRERIHQNLLWKQKIMSRERNILN